MYLSLLFHQRRENCPKLYLSLLSCCLALPLFFAVCFAEPALALPAESKIIFQADTFSGALEWDEASQRDEIRPEFFVAEKPSLLGPGSLGLYGASNYLARGCWRKVVPGIIAGKHYRFEASYFTRGVDYPRLKVFARLEWRDSEGKETGKRAYVPETDYQNEWQKVEGTFRAPQGAQAVSIELYLSHCAQGRAYWDAITLTEIPDPPKRPVRLGTVNCRPSGHKSSMESVEDFCQVAEEAGRKGCDIVCLGEGINMVGVAQGNTYAHYYDIAEPVPGPTTRRLGEVASKYKMYIVAAIGEREGRAIYNTAVLIDRRGEVVGKYRKVYLPEMELDDGCQPGDSYPVFDTDFGRVGIMICYDSWYVDPARALALQGAEIILLPIWGGDSTLIRARAIENHTYLASCGYDCASVIYDPWGTLLARASERPGVAITEIDLNYPPPCPYPWPLNDMRLMLLHERRSDVQVPASKR